MDLLIVDRWAKQFFWGMRGMDFASTKQLPDYQLHAFLTLYIYSLGFFFSFEVKHPGKICQLVGVRNHSIFGCCLKSWLPTENTSIVGIPWVNVNETGNVTVNVTVNETNKTIGSGGVRKPGGGCSVQGKMCCFFTIDMGKLYLKVFGR